MGQIIIDIPVEKNFHYEVADVNEYRKLLEILDDLSRTDLSVEDLEDVIYAEKILRNGDFVAWDDVKADLK